MNKDLHNILFALFISIQLILNNKKIFENKYRKKFDGLILFIPFFVILSSIAMFIKADSTYIISEIHLIFGSIIEILLIRKINKFNLHNEHITDEIYFLIKKEKILHLIISYCGIFVMIRSTLNFIFKLVFD